MDNKSDNEKQLDFETLSATSLADPSKPLKLYLNRERALRASIQSRIFSLILLAFPCVFFLLLYSVLRLICGETAMFLKSIYIISAIAMYVILVPAFILIDFFNTKAIKQSIKPVIEIDSDGLSIHCTGRNYEKIPWEYIQEVKMFCWLNWRCVRVVPHDPISLAPFASEDETHSGKNLTAMTKTLIAITKFLPFKGKGVTAKMKLVSTPPFIDVADAFLPLDAEEVVEAINIRLYHYKRLGNGN